MFKASSKKSQIEENELVYRFGPFRLETAERVLRDGDRPLAITPKAFDILLLLVRNHGHLVSKQRLLETVWPDTFVEESTLTQNIFTLRKTLGREYIETVPKHGYRFRADPEGSGRPRPLGADETSAPLARWWIAAAVVLALTSLFLLRRHTLADTAFRSIAVERLTNGGDVTEVALSPEGKYVAYASAHGDMQSLFVRQLETATVVEIVPPAPVGFRGITFSRHGEWIYYVTVPRNSFIGTLYRIALVGGAPQRVLQESVGSRVELSPDGRQIAYVHWIDDLHTALKIANLDGSGERQLARLDYDDGFAVEGPAWSPDGKTILAATRSYNGSRPFVRVVAIDLAGGGQRTFLGGRWNWIGQMSWLADGSGVVLTAWSSEDTMSDQVWLMRYPSGESRRISNDINGYLGVGVSADAKVIAASTSIPARNFWVGAQRITNGSGELYSERLGAKWTPGGRVVFASRLGGTPHIWIMDADGSRQQQLTSGDSADLQPAVSPDGSIAFVSNNQLWRMNADGTHRRRLAAMEGAAWPAFSPDGRWIFWTVRGRLWRVAADGGAPVQLTHDAAEFPAVSPDGKSIACLMPDDAPGPGRLTLFDVETGRVVKRFDTRIPRSTLQWAPDGRSITYVITRNGVSNIWSQPAGGGAAVPLTDWKADVIYRFDWSRDGRLLCERGTTVADVILVRDAS